MRPLPIDTSTDNGAAKIGWFNEETGEWDKAEPDLPAFMKNDPLVTEDRQNGASE